MRLALIRQRYNPFGGAERFVSRALQALGGQQVSVTVFARDWEGAPAQASWVRCDPFYIGRLWRDAGFARAVRRELRARRFDLVQSHERIDGCDVYRAGDGVHAQWLENRARALGGGPALPLRPYHAYVLAAERRVFESPRLRAVICNSRMVAGEIGRRFGLAEEKLKLIYNGVDLDEYHPRLKVEHRARLRAQFRIGESETVFLLVGSGFERKGVERLLSAFARLRGARTRLWIVGADRRLEALRARARALGVAERVHFAGAQRDVRPWYGAADCFVLPSLYDPFPNAALEAMACGLPVITSQSCGAAELIAEGENGFVCDALDEAGLAARMDSIDAGTARAMGERARAGVAGFTLEAMGERLAALYRALAATGQRCG